MLSRRNVRIKVMQMLYSMSRDKKLSFDEALLRYKASIGISFELYLFNLFQFIRVAEYSRQDAARKQAKLLPTEEDKQFTAKLADNEQIRSLSKNEGLNRLFASYKLAEKSDSDSTRRIYYNFSKTEEYKQYVNKENTRQEDHKNIILSLFKHCSGSEIFNDLIEDYFPLWIEDKSLVIGAVKKSLKGLPAEGDFYEDHRPPVETTREFGEKLLRMVCEFDAELLSLIEPTLKNWDVDRVAVIDMILLKMALCEFMNFSTIPTKVTLNEFVEISKLYSTEKSKDFINGILDRLMKKLNTEGKIIKKGRGLME